MVLKTQVQRFHITMPIWLKTHIGSAAGVISDFIRKITRLFLNQSWGADIMLLSRKVLKHSAVKKSLLMIPGSSGDDGLPDYPSQVKLLGYNVQTDHTRNCWDYADWCCPGSWSSCSTHGCCLKKRTNRSLSCRHRRNCHQWNCDNLKQGTRW